MKKRKQLSGSAKMKLLGKKPILLWVTLEQYDRIKEAAGRQLRPMTQFILFNAMKAAETVAEGVGRGQ